MEKDDSFIDNLRELINGGYIMLFIFGGTICFMASVSLLAAMFTNNAEKISMLSKVLDTLLGFIAGAYTTMWNNQHFKEKNNKLNEVNGKEKKDEKVVNGN